LIVRDKAGAMRIFPAATLTNAPPASRFDVVALLTKFVLHPVYWHLFTAGLTVIVVALLMKHGVIGGAP
jgi:hypothetical protein